MFKRKFTDEELSRILSAHEDQTLALYFRNAKVNIGPDEVCVSNKCGCINQIAYNVDLVCCKNGSDSDCVTLNPFASDWFELNYFNWWTADEFLYELEKAGLA